MLNLDTVSLSSIPFLKTLSNSPMRPYLPIFYAISFYANSFELGTSRRVRSSGITFELNFLPFSQLPPEQESAWAVFFLK